MPAAGHQTPPFVSLQVEAGDLYGHAEHGRSNGDGHLVLEDLEEPRHLLVGVVGIHGDLLDEPGERLHHGGTVLPGQDAVTNVLGLERPFLWGTGGGRPGDHHRHHRSL